jgi:biopolymer transport protein ExbD
MKRRSRESVTPEITPLIDVVFLLLIFFMVSTVFKKDELALLLSLPQTSEGESPDRQVENIVIELSETEVAIGGIKLSIDEIDQELEKISNKTTPIDLRIDKGVVYERMIKVLDRLKYYELTNLSLITDP